MKQTNNRFAKQKQPSYVLLIKIIDFVLCAAIITLIILFYASIKIDSFKFLGSTDLAGLIMIILGPIIFTMPLISSNFLQGENKGDNMMLIFGLLLVVLGILTMIL